MKILLISLYYPPLNNIASSRIASFNKHLTKHGHKVTVLTREYNKETLNKSSLLIGSSQGSSLPGGYKKEDNTYYTEYNIQNSKKSKSDKLPPGIKGIYNTLQGDIFHYSFVENGYKCYLNELKNNDFDIIIASSPVIASLILAKKISRNHNIPWIADFRDTVFRKNEKTILVKLKIHFLKKLLTSSKGILFVSEGMLKQFEDKIPEIENISKTIIRNGFEPTPHQGDTNTINKIEKIKSLNEITLLYTGSLYPEGNLDHYLKWLKNIKNNNIALITIGIQEEYITEINTNFTDLNITHLPKCSHETCIAAQKLADFLLLTIWKDNYTGFQGKIFEYIYSDQKVVLDVKPPDDLKFYLEKFNNVFYCNESENNFRNIILDKKTPATNSTKIKYSLTRAYQNDKLNDFIINRASN